MRTFPTHIVPGQMLTVNVGIAGTNYVGAFDGITGGQIRLVSQRRAKTFELDAVNGVSEHLDHQGEIVMKGASASDETF